MKLVVGLGNPGKRYEQTRHNVGFMVIDELIGKLTVSPHIEKKFASLVFYHHESQTCLVRPQTFMNRSGEAVGSVVGFYKVPMDKLYVVHDDLDINLGEYKIQKGKGPKQHNGLQSIYAALGTKDFWHVRVGIENRGEILRLSGASPVRQAQGRHRARTAQDDTASLESLDAVSSVRLKGVKISGEEYVLQPFTVEDKGRVSGVVEAVTDDLGQRLFGSLGGGR